MQIPLQISFKHIEPSPALEATIRKKAERLEKYFPRITSLRTVVTQSTPRHRQGNFYHVRIDLTVPGRELVVGNEFDMNHAHEDPYVAVRDAFRSARRQMQDYIRIHFKKRPRHHEPPRVP